MIKNLHPFTLMEIALVILDCTFSAFLRTKQTLINEVKEGSICCFLLSMCLELKDVLEGARRARKAHLRFPSVNFATKNDIFPSSVIYIKCSKLNIYIKSALIHLNWNRMEHIFKFKTTNR